MGIGLVHVRSWQVAYRGLVPQDFLDRLDPVRRGEHWERQLSAKGEQSGRVLVAEVDGHVVGFAAIGPSSDEDGGGDGEVRAIYLLVGYWGQGIGKALMGSALDALRQAGFSQATLWALVTNLRVSGKVNGDPYTALDHHPGMLFSHQQAEIIISPGSLLLVCVNVT
jgi:GNAT superfamily N-acetyltransferase